MRVVVCGAGIAGLAAAVTLATHGCDVVLVERACAPRTEGYLIDFFGPGHTPPLRRWDCCRLSTTGPCGCGR